MVDLHSYNYPSATRTNLPTDQTERFMEPEDYEDQGFRPEPMDNSAHPTLHWNRKPLEEFQHGPLYIQEKIHPAVLIQSALKEQGKQIDLFRPVQRATRGSKLRLVPVRRRLAKPLDPWRRQASDGEPRAARRAGRTGADHIHGPAL